MTVKKLQKKAKLRNAEYFGLQEVLDRRMMTPTNPRWMNSLTAWKCGTRSISP